MAKDCGRAVKLLRRGVEMNDAESCFELGKLFESGTGVGRSICDAEKLYRRWGALNNIRCDSCINGGAHTPPQHPAAVGW